MNNYQESKLSMYMVSRDFMSANIAILSPLPDFTANFATFKNTIVQIQGSLVQQTLDKTGIAKNKDLLKQTLVTLAADTARKLKAYATFTNNLTLLAEVNYSESKLKRFADTVLRDAAKIIYNCAQPVVALLAAYGVSDATQAALLNAIDAYGASIPQPRLGITEKRQATMQIAAFFKIAEATLGRIDIAIDIIKLTQANFHYGYKKARKLILTGGGSVSVKGKVTDALTGEPVKLVILKFSLTGVQAVTKATRDKGIVTKKSANKGGFMVKSLAEGTYNVVISKPGYKEQTATVIVIRREMSVLDIKLEKV